MCYHNLQCIWWLVASFSNKSCKLISPLIAFMQTARTLTSKAQSLTLHSALLKLCHTNKLHQRRRFFVEKFSMFSIPTRMKYIRFLRENKKKVWVSAFPLSLSRVQVHWSYIVRWYKTCYILYLTDQSHVKISISFVKLIFFKKFIELFAKADSPYPW